MRERAPHPLAHHEAAGKSVGPVAEVGDVALNQASSARELGGHEGCQARRLPPAEVQDRFPDELRIAGHLHVQRSDVITADERRELVGPGGAGEVREQGGTARAEDQAWVTDCVTAG